MRTTTFVRALLPTSLLALGACAFGGPNIGEDDGDFIVDGPGWDYGMFDDGQYESAEGTLMVVSDAGEGAQLVGAIGSVRDLDHTANVDVVGMGGTARVTMTVDRTDDGPAMAIFYINGDLREIVRAGEVVLTPDSGSETRPYTAAVTGCWTPGWQRESSTEQVAVTAVADPESQTIDLVFTARFRGNDGEVVGHTVLSYEEVDASEVYERGYYYF